MYSKYSNQQHLECCICECLPNALLPELLRASAVTPKTRHSLSRVSKQHIPCIVTCMLMSLRDGDGDRSPLPCDLILPSVQPKDPASVLIPLKYHIHVINRLLHYLLQKTIGN